MLNTRKATIVALCCLAAIVGGTIGGVCKVSKEAKQWQEQVEVDMQQVAFGVVAGVQVPVQLLGSRNEPVETVEQTETQEEEPVYQNDEYLLAKLLMCEAGAESFDAKYCVAMVVLNRIASDQFPDTLEGVIFQSDEGVYQFSPVRPEGSWYYTEPNQQCYQAVQAAHVGGNGNAMGALYFEACTDTDNWHSQNLEFLFEVDGIRFYK